MHVFGKKSIGLLPILLFIHSERAIWGIARVLLEAVPVKDLDVVSGSYPGKDSGGPVPTASMRTKVGV